MGSGYWSCASAAAGAGTASASVRAIGRGLGESRRESMTTTPADIGADDRDRRPEQADGEGDAQEEWVEAEILAERLADPEHRVLAPENRELLAFHHLLHQQSGARGPLDAGSLSMSRARSRMSRFFRRVSRNGLAGPGLCGRALHAKCWEMPPIAAAFIVRCRPLHCPRWRWRHWLRCGSTGNWPPPRACAPWRRARSRPWFHNRPPCWRCARLVSSYISLTERSRPGPQAASAAHRARRASRGARFMAPVYPSACSRHNPSFQRKLESPCLWAADKKKGIPAYAGMTEGVDVGWKVGERFCCPVLPVPLVSASVARCGPNRAFVQYNLVREDLVTRQSRAPRYRWHLWF